MNVGQSPEALRLIRKVSVYFYEISYLSAECRDTQRQLKSLKASAAFKSRLRVVSMGGEESVALERQSENTLVQIKKQNTYIDGRP
jgi:hypothetical protein